LYKRQRPFIQNALMYALQSVDVVHTRDSVPRKKVAQTMNNKATIIV